MTRKCGAHEPRFRARYLAGRCVGGPRGRAPGGAGRGRPASRRLWGNAVSVLAGDLLLVEALRLTSSGAPDATFPELVATLGRLVDGEIVQLRGRVAVSLEEETYFEVVRQKTASLFE